MRKSRCKADIRARAAAELGELARQAANERAFKQPIAQSWHDVFLAVLGTGATVEIAAAKAGVTRAGVRYARQHNRRFDEAYGSAYGRGLRLRFQHRGAENATNGWTMDRGSSTTKQGHWTL